MAEEPRKTLIMRIYQILEKYSDIDHPLTQNDIIKYLDQDFDIVCERKAVGRNISYLKEMGYEIESTAGGNYLAVREIENSELRVLIDSVLCARNINSHDSKDLIDKLISLGSVSFKSHVRHVYSVDEWEKSQNKQFFLNVELIDEAIEKGKQIQFDYNRIGFDKKLHLHDEGRTGSPYQLLLNNQRYYLMLHDNKYNDMGFLRLDKMTNVQILKDNALPLKKNPGFERGINYKDLATGLPYMFNDRPARIELLCAGDMLDHLYDWFGSNFTITQKGGVGEPFTVVIKASKRAIFYWVLQYSQKVQVLSPCDLRNEVKDALAAALKRYE